MAGQFQEEIHKELEKIADKYHITKGMLLMEETDKDNPTVKRNRVIVFQDSNTKTVSLHDMGLLYQACIEISKTFRDIVNHLGMHMLEEVMGKGDLLQKGAKRAD